MGAVTALTDLVELLALEERVIDRTELYLAEEAFYCGTGQEMVPILSFDRKPVGDGSPGPATRTLQDHYDAIVRGRVSRYRHWLTPVYPESNAT